MENDSVHVAGGKSDSPIKPIECGSLPTPGPWVLRGVWVLPNDHAERPVGGSTNRKEHADKYAHVVATVCNDERRFAGKTWKANARLIAAAPDLLFALQSLVNAASPFNGKRPDRNSYTTSGLGHHFETAVAALAKATGEQQ